MTVKVKICGVRTPAILETAVAAGADFVGLVFFATSPRNLGLQEAASLVEAARGRVATVAVMVDPDDALIDQVAQTVSPDLLQLHGHETPERVAAIKARTRLPVIKAIPVAVAADIAAADAYAGIADEILFDAKAAPDAALPGGNGVPFDWRMLAAARPPFGLSGGLNPGNIAEAVRLTGAHLVDVSSGVESAAGVKDEELILRFIQGARGATQQQAKAS
ncbi:N-(5'-phosphoribosyl)anthranilate isomerase [Methyloceanibacter superfactus]|uniref:N-(5'-phosphoribosyl)anthranilate isomerase n=1 Tax=Methyloceanibacter superfactus TaxID=1774969 RepID=A0A1E3W7F7_9HYPH|nr:phosphoribosylanthranilate isomerase [Methyloceanibacter superfactus]ODS01758.1 N-(5'-phosphoribosyl)anthranilate isomerase [Methyloceanibacter superfactus]